MSNSASKITITPPTTKKVKLIESEIKDRLSDLTDCVILHILSFLNTKDAVQTCILSPKTLDFKRDVGRLNPNILKMIVEYAISHNVQRLGLFVVGGIAQIPPIIFSCKTLTHLKLCIYNKGGHETMFPKSFNLSALTSL
ncbi:hypothetical protein MTR_3g011790 [Medicago truncatula]|uniref:F-box domain-containing protein n=1 Tax=Medicago truncatula TaxID=3880 RepID=A0A072V471_MEDTR|nr:hypothetical protein MTR_3g011790 [Medicago truncatula]